MIAPNSRVVKPISVASYTPPTAPTARVACDPSEARVIYVRFADAKPGERVSGFISDDQSQSRVDFDVVVGRDSVVGGCADRNYSSPDRVKVCFPSAVGVYFTSHLRFDSFELERGFAASALCETSAPMTIDLRKGS